MDMHLLWQKILWLCDKCIHSHNKRTEKNTLLEFLHKYLLDHFSLIHGRRSSKSHNPFLEVTFSMFFELCLNLRKVMKTNMVFYIVIHFPISPPVQVIMNLQCYNLAFPLKFNSQQAPLHILLFYLLKIRKHCRNSISNSIAIPWNVLLQEHKIFTFATRNSGLTEFIILFFRAIGYKVWLSAQNGGPVCRQLKFWISIAWRYRMCYPELDI